MEPLLPLAANVATPEGYVFFNYVVDTGANDSQFTASAQADIDADGSGQTWGYKKGTVAGGAHGNGFTDCVSANLTPETVGPCASAYLQMIQEAVLKDERPENIQALRDALDMRNRALAAGQFTRH